MHTQDFLFRPRVIFFNAMSSGRVFFLALSAAGHARSPSVHFGSVFTTAQVWASAGRRGAYSGRSKSTELALFHFIAFRDAEPPRTMETPQSQLFALLLVSHRPSSSRALYFVAATGTTAVTHQALPFVKATDCAFRVCACVCQVSCPTKALFSQEPSH